MIHKECPRHHDVWVCPGCFEELREAYHQAQVQKGLLLEMLLRSLCLYRRGPVPVGQGPAHL